MGRSTRLPRRELFDVRLQLMAEDDTISNDDPSKRNYMAGLDTTDLSPNVYEGGYKTWECSLDLVKYLLDRGPRKDLDDLHRVDHVIEMGCGSALPSLLLFQCALKEELRMFFTLTDYNFDVLRLVTLPNLLLTWCGTLPVSRSTALFGEEGNPLLGEVDAGDLYVTQELLSAFKQMLATKGITLTFLSGSWSPTKSFLSLVPSSPELNTFILGSETIYSPASLMAFTGAIAALMARVNIGKALVAAKRVYFGVGGSVDGFKEECSKHKCLACEVDFEGLESNGVRRCLVEIQKY